MNDQSMTAIVMAAGFSKRMGEQNKLLLPFDNHTLLEHTLEILSQAPSIYETIVVVRTGDVARVCVGKADKIIFNHYAQEGISASIRIGVKQASGNFYLFLPGDQPLLTAQHIEQICQHAQKGKIVVPCTEKTPKGPCLFSNSFKNDLLDLQGDQGGKQIIRKNSQAIIYTTIYPNEALDDADTWENYNRIKKISKKI